MIDPSAVVSRLMLCPSIMEQLAPTDLAHGEVDLGIATSHMATDAQVDVYRSVGDPWHYAHAVHTYRRLHPAGEEHP